MGATVDDILSEGRLEEACVLKGEGDLAHQLRLGDILHVDPSDEDAPCSGIPEARDESGDSRLPRPGGAYEGIDLPLGHVEGDVL